MYHLEGAVGNFRMRLCKKSRGWIENHESDWTSIGHRKMVIKRNGHQKAA